MKKRFILLMAYMFIAAAFLSRQAGAQSPEKMSYQAVVRNSSNQLVTNHTVGMRISTLQGSASGSAVYVETQTPTSNANGLVTVAIGGGTVVSGSFSSIDWSNGPYFIKTETDPAGGTNYTITGTSQLLSVPYALHAKIAENVTGGITETDPVFVASPANEIAASSINNWNTAYNWGNHTQLYRPVTWVPAWADVTQKPTFAAVATSGSYNDLTNKPTFLNSQWNNQGDNIYFNSGNVGIGITSPIGKLEVGGVIKGIMANGTNPACGQIQSWTNGTAQGLKAVYSFYPTFQNTQDNAPRRAADIVSGFDGGPWGKEYIAFNVGNNSQPNDNQSVTQEKMRITGSGNVGIGVVNPNAKLEVAGQIKITGGTPAIGEVLTSDGTGLATWESINSHYIGEFYGGGKVFYVYDNGRHGLIAATEDQSEGTQWYNGTEKYTGSKGDGVGAGEMNTALIVAAQIGDNKIGNFAAQICADYSKVVGGVYYGDWYLPSHHELNRLYNQKDIVGAFTSDYYWSSTELNYFNALSTSFSDGIGHGNGKSPMYRVRAIRAF